MASTSSARKTVGKKAAAKRVRGSGPRATDSGTESVTKVTRVKGVRVKGAKAKKGGAYIPEDEPQAEPGTQSLVIVESPAKAKTISKYLGRGYKVRATIGHIRDLPEKRMGIDVDNGFEPEYVTIAGKEKTLAELKSAAREAKGDLSRDRP